MMTTKQELADQVKQLADDIRAYSESQVHLWQQLPNLTLEAYTGLLFLRTPCIRYGFWDFLRGGLGPRLGVDCATGQIVHCTPPAMYEAEDEDILWIATNLDSIDAARIIGDLTESANNIKQHGSGYMGLDPKERDIAVAQFRREYDLGYGIPYTRKQPNSAYSW